jgi:hypothetical protein
MIQVQLKRSGGFAGIILQANGTLDYDKNNLMSEIKNAKPDVPDLQRDAFTYSLTIGSNNYLIDPDKFSGKLRSEISRLMNDLSAK